MAHPSQGTFTLALTRLALALSIFLIVGCKAMSNDIDRSNFAGIASMNDNGDLTLQMFDAPKGADTQLVKRGEPYYKEYVNLIGGIAPGERKPIPRNFGQVHMNLDRSVDYMLVADADSGRTTRVVGSAKPGDPNYSSMLDRVNGLEPGQTKFIVEPVKAKK